MTPPNSHLDTPEIPNTADSPDPAALDMPAGPEAPAAPAPPPRPRITLAGLQTFVGLTAGMISILGALLSISGAFTARPGKGEVVAVITEAKTDKAVSGATVELLTPGKLLVSTMRLNALGRARSVVVEGPYQMRVSHPQYAAETRQVQVLSGQTAVIRVRLRAGTSSPLRQGERAALDGVSAAPRPFLQ